MASGRLVILDASSLWKGWSPLEGDMVYTPSSVRDEMLKMGDVPMFLKVDDPSGPALESVDKASSGTGDDARLSPADRDLLALALDLRGTLITEDFSIQNTAETLGIEWASLGEPISEVRTWKYRCKGCLKVYREMLDDCPVCGSTLRSYGGKR